MLHAEDATAADARGISEFSIHITSSASMHYYTTDRAALHAQLYQ